METNFLLRHLKPVIILLIMMSIHQTAWGVDLVTYNLFSSFNSTSGLPENYPSCTFSTTAANPAFTGSNLSASGWDAGTPGGYKCFETSAFSTFGYLNIVVNASMFSASNGPKNFDVQYRLTPSEQWTTIASISITTQQRNYGVTLPNECINKGVVYIRWVATSYVTSSIAKTYISNVSIVGDLPTAPDTQASYLSFVSITPTTITTSCTPGNGDNRIIVMNSVNSFSNPENDYKPIADPVYKGGEQVVYNGPESSVQVTVPSSTNIYYFRVFEYKYNNGVTRYLTSTANNNPNECALERITPNAATNIGLISATLGATIATPTRSYIFDRGIVWSTSPGVLETDNPASDGGNSGGSFSLNFPNALYEFPEMPRGSTIYYRGYVTNLSGTIYSEELSFSNVPVFLGTGNWETAALWNVKEVPGTNGSVNGSINDNPVINGVCTMTTSHACTDLTINASKKLTIQPGIALTVHGTVTNNAGVSGLLIKASSSAANGSIIFANPAANTSVPASVEMYSKAHIDTKYHWQYFGIPVQQTTVGTTFNNIGHRVRKYDETNIDPTLADIGLWKPTGAGATMAADEALVPIDGYEVTQPSATTYTFKGNLYTSNINKTLNYTTSADWAGNHIIANPYAGAINISKISFGVNMEAAVYIYNTGSREEWETGSGSSTPGSAPGTYSVSTGGFAGVFGVPSQIPSMQGFLVKETGTSTITIPYSAVVQGTTQQRTPSATTNFPATRIDVVGTKSSDRLWIFTGSDFTSKFDNGWDGRKLIVSGVPQLYTLGEDGEYQIAAIADINNTSLGFQAPENGEYKLVFAHENANYGDLYLIDQKENTITDISDNGSEYNFTASTSDTYNRFRIATMTTGCFVKKNNKNQIFSTDNTIFVRNNGNSKGLLQIYNINGKPIRQMIVERNETISIPTNIFASGVYIAKLKTDAEELTERLILH